MGVVRGRSSGCGERYVGPVGVVRGRSSGCGER